MNRPMMLVPFFDEDQNKFFVLKWLDNKGCVSIKETLKIADELKESAQILTDDFLEEVEESDLRKERINLNPEKYLDDYGRDKYWNAFGGDEILESRQAIEKKKEQEKETGYIYVVKEFTYGYYKIGKSKNPLNRAKSLHNSSMDGVELITYFYTNECSSEEERLHHFFKDKNVHSEWFNLNETDIEFLINQ